MFRIRSITLTTIAALALGASAATAATDPVGSQQTYAGKTAPTSFPGGKLHKGQTVPSNATIVLRKVELEAGEHAKIVLTVPKGMRLNSFAETGNLRLRVPPKSSSWVGHRRITLTAYATGDDAATGTLYALGRR